MVSVSVGFFRLALAWVGEGFFVAFDLVGFFFFWPVGVPEDLAPSGDPAPDRDQIHLRALGMVVSVPPEFFSAMGKGNED